MFVALDTRESPWGKPSYGHVLRPPKRSLQKSHAEEGVNENAGGYSGDALAGSSQEPRVNGGLLFGGPIVDLNDVEYIEQAHEARLEAIRTYGYTYLMPPGVGKTMQAMLEEQDLCEETLDHETMGEFEDSTLGGDASVQTDTFAGRRTAPHEPLGSEPHILFDPSSVADNGLEEEEEDEMEEELDLDAEVPEASDDGYDDNYDESDYQEGFMVDENYSENEENADRVTAVANNRAQDTRPAVPTEEEDEDEEILDYTMDDSNRVQAVKDMMFGKNSGPPSGAVLEGLGDDDGFRGSSAQVSEAEEGDEPGEIQLTYGSSGICSSPRGNDSDDGEADMSF